MGRKRLKDILDGAERATPLWPAAPLVDRDPADDLIADWRAAASDARSAYAAWRRRRDRDTYVVYRAHADRADAAQDALAAARSV